MKTADENWFLSKFSITIRSLDQNQTKSDKKKSHEKTAFEITFHFDLHQMMRYFVLGSDFRLGFSITDVVNQFLSPERI